MRNLITIIESKDSEFEYINATSWSVLPKYLAKKYPYVKLAATNWGMVGNGVGDGGETRVWPLEFDHSRWPGEESKLSNRNPEAYGAVIRAIEYVTPQNYRDIIDSGESNLYFRINPKTRDGDVVGGYVEVVDNNPNIIKSFNDKFSSIIKSKPTLNLPYLVTELGELFDENPEEVTDEYLEKARSSISKSLSDEDYYFTAHCSDENKENVIPYMAKYFFDQKLFDQYLKAYSKVDPSDADSLDLLLGDWEYLESISKYWSTSSSLNNLAKVVASVTGDIEQFIRLAGADAVTPDILKLFITKIASDPEDSDENLENFFDILDSRLEEISAETLKLYNTLKKKYGDKVNAPISQPELSNSDREELKKQDSSTIKSPDAHPARSLSDDQLIAKIQRNPSDLFNIPADMRTLERWVIAVKGNPSILNAATQPGLKEKIEAAIGKPGEGDLQRLKELGGLK